MYIKGHHFEFDLRDTPDEPYHCIIRVHMTESERLNNLDIKDQDLALLDIIDTIREDLFNKIEKESKDI